MELLPDYLRVTLPPVGSQQDFEPDRRTIYAKYFIPSVIYTWLVAEGEECDGEYVFYGYVVNEVGEGWGEFSLSDLEQVNQKVAELKDVLDMDGLCVERVLNFETVIFPDAI